MLAHSRTRDFAFRQAPILLCILVPLVVGLLVAALDFVIHGI